MFSPHSTALHCSYTFSEENAWECVDSTCREHCPKFFLHILKRLCTGWRRLIGCLKLQVIFHKRATNYTSLVRKVTYEDKACYDSTPPCSTALHSSCTFLRECVALPYIHPTSYTFSYSLYTCCLPSTAPPRDQRLHICSPPSSLEKCVLSTQHCPTFFLHILLYCLHVLSTQHCPA